MPTPQLYIPDYFIPGIKKLISLDEGQVTQLISALQAEDPVLGESELADHVAEKIKTIAPGDVADIIHSLTGLLTVQASTEFSLTQFSQMLYEASERQKLIPPDPAAWESFKKNIEIILTLEGPLAVASKAYNVTATHDHVFDGVRVLTDLRAIFKQDPTELPSAIAVIHTLKIDYHQNGKLRAFFVAMDDDDITKLKAALNRAELKSKSLKKLISSTKTPILKI